MPSASDTTRSVLPTSAGLGIGLGLGFGLGLGLACEWGLMSSPSGGRRRATSCLGAYDGRC